MKLREILKKIYRVLFPDYIYELRTALKNVSSLLDVGCGSDSPVQYLPQNIYKVGVDSFEPSLTKSQTKNIHQRYVKTNVLEIDQIFKSAEFDSVLASDVIEHLTPEEGIKLLDMMEKIACKKVVVFTPNGFLPQRSLKNNPHQIHKSGWIIDDFKNRGYKVIGINGLKGLRGELAQIKFKPQRLWQFVSDFTQIFTKHYPKLGFQLLAIKTLDTNGEKGNLRDPKTLSSS